jgi:hypothetical protein
MAAFPSIFQIKCLPVPSKQFLPLPFKFLTWPVKTYPSKKSGQKLKG